MAGSRPVKDQLDLGNSRRAGPGKAELTQLVTATAPRLVALPGVGVDTAGQLLVTAGYNAGRLHTEPTRAYVARRTAEGKTKTEILRCLKRCIAREACPLLAGAHRGPAATADYSGSLKYQR
jgi:hypothetical protein